MINFNLSPPNAPPKGHSVYRTTDTITYVGLRKVEQMIMTMKKVGTMREMKSKKMTMCKQYFNAPLDFTTVRMLGSALLPISTIA